MSKKDRASLAATLKATEAQVSVERSTYHQLGTDFKQAADRVKTRLAVLIATGASAKDALGVDWRPWAALQGVGFGSLKDDGSFGNLTPPSLYRYRNAGAVATVLGDAVGEASYTALVPLYRFITAAKTEEEATAANAAITAHWAEACKTSRDGVPTEESVRALSEESQGTSRGKTGKTAPQRKTAAAAKAAKLKAGPSPEDTAGKATVVIDPAAVEAVGKVSGAMIRKYVKEGTAEAVVRSIMLATIRLAREHGADTVAASLAGTK